MTSATTSSTAPGDRAPGPIAPSATTRFQSRDGTDLYAEFTAAENPRAAALIVHGYAEHCGRYREVAHVLQATGIASLAFDVRGHGRSAGQRGYVRKFSDYLDDLDAAFEVLTENLGDDGNVPRIIVAHSNGALITLRALADPWRAPKGIVAAVLSSPFLGLKLEVSPVKSLIGKFASRAMPSLALPNELRVDHLTRDAEKQRERRVDTLCHDVANARWFTEAADAQEFILEFAHRVTLPTLWLVSGADRIADPAASRRVHARLGAPADYHEFPDLEHEVFNERTRGEAFEHMRTYLESQIPQK